MKEKIKSIIEKAQVAHMRKTFYQRDKWMINELILPQLTSEEITEVNKVWQFLKANQNDLIWHRVYKKEYGFDPYFITDYHLINILKRSNPYKQVSSLENKAMLDVYFPDIKFPFCYIKSINGVKWCNGSVISLEDTINYLLSNRIYKFVIKPTVETGCGKGVKIINLENTENRKEYLSGLISSYGKDFSIQEILQQHNIINQLNPTSVNSCRVTTIFLNGKFHYSTCLKIGKNGSTVDNWHSSYIVGVDKNGMVLPKGVDNRLRPVVKTDSGIPFSGIILPNYQNMIHSIQGWHQKYFPQVGIIGWDVLVDNKDDIRVIEVNLTSPGNVAEQYASGTFFKECRDDIVSLMLKNANK